MAGKIEFPGSDDVIQEITQRILQENQALP